MCVCVCVTNKRVKYWNKGGERVGFFFPSLPLAISHLYLSYLSFFAHFPPLLTSFSSSLLSV